MDRESKLQDYLDQLESEVNTLTDNYQSIVVQNKSHYKKVIKFWLWYHLPRIFTILYSWLFLLSLKDSIELFWLLVFSVIATICWILMYFSVLIIIIRYFRSYDGSMGAGPVPNYVFDMTEIYQDIIIWSGVSISILSPILLYFINLNIVLSLVIGYQITLKTAHYIYFFIL